MWFKSNKSKKEKHPFSKPSVLSENDIQDRLYGEFQVHSGNGEKIARRPPSPASTAVLQSVSVKPGSRTNLFGQDIVEEPKGAIISRAMMKDIVPSASSHPSGLFEEDKNLHRKVMGEIIKKFQPSKKEAKKEPQKEFKPISRDFPGTEDKPNFQLEWKEWGDRIRSISIWHVVTALSCIVGLIILFNVFVNLAFDKRSSLLEVKPKSVEQDLTEGIPLPEPAQNLDVSPEISATAEELGMPIADELRPADKDKQKSISIEKGMASSKTAGTKFSSSTTLTGLAKPYHVVQVCIYENEKAAERLVEELKGLGYPRVTYETMQTGSGRKLYRVYCGQFANFREAQDGLKQFQKMGLLKRFPDGFIRQVK